MNVEKIVPYNGSATFSKSPDVVDTAERVFERKENPRVVRFVAKPRSKKKRGMR